MYYNNNFGIDIKDMAASECKNHCGDQFQCVNLTLVNEFSICFLKKNIRQRDNKLYIRLRELDVYMPELRTSILGNSVMMWYNGSYPCDGENKCGWGALGREKPIEYITFGDTPVPCTSESSSGSEYGCINVTRVAESARCFSASAITEKNGILIVNLDKLDVYLECLKSQTLTYGVALFYNKHTGRDTEQVFPKSGTQTVSGYGIPLCDS